MRLLTRIHPLPPSFVGLLLAASAAAASTVVSTEAAKALGAAEDPYGDLLGDRFYLAFFSIAALVLVVWYAVARLASRSKSAYGPGPYAPPFSAAPGLSEGFFRRLHDPNAAEPEDTGALRGGKDFLERAKKAFMRVQVAWRSRDLWPVRHMLADGTAESFRIRLALEPGPSYRDRQDLVRIDSARVVHAHSDGHHDTVHVRMEGSLTDNVPSVAGGRRMGGTGYPASFVEVWSFVRRTGAPDVAQGSLEGLCPSCGHPVRGEGPARCPACRRPLLPGEDDWTVAEITQDAEWRRPTRRENLPGLAELAASDPAFNPQLIDDHGAAMFWRWIAACSGRSLRPLEWFAAPRFVAEAERLVSGGTDAFSHVTIGSVEFCGVGRRDGAAWADVGVRFHGRRDGAEPDQPPGQESMMLRLERNPKVVHAASTRFRSLSCDNCGAALWENDGGSCAYCKTPLGGASMRPWLLSSVLRGEWKADAAA